MNAHTTLTAALLDVRVYLAREAQAEEFRNEAAWEAGSSREERAAIDALARLDAAIGQLKATGRLADKPARARPAPKNPLAPTSLAA